MVIDVKGLNQKLIKVSFSKDSEDLNNIMNTIKNHYKFEHSDKNHWN